MQALLDKPSVVKNAINLLKRPPANNIVRLGAGARAANSIVNFARPAIAVGKGALAAKAALLLAAFGTGYLIGEGLKGLWNWLNQPKPKPKKTGPMQPLENFTALAQPTEKPVRFYYKVKHFRQRPKSYSCSSGNKVYNGEEYMNESTLSYVGQNIRFNSGMAEAQSHCEGSYPPTEQKVIYQIDTYSDGKWEQRARSRAVHGDVKSWQYSSRPSEEYYEFSGLSVPSSPEIAPLIRPFPPQFPVQDPPAPIPIPEVEPEMLPGKGQPIRPPRIAPSRVKPADPEPVRPPNPQTDPSLPQPQPFETPRVKPPLTTPKPATKPATKPNTTTNTTIAGNQVPPSRGIVPTTPKDVHKYGNAGGRVAGRSASTNPVQMAQELGRVEQKLNAIGKSSLPDMDLEDWFSLLKDIFELLTSVTPGTTYKLKAVCECPEDDDQCQEPEIEQKIGSAMGTNATIARLDAIAELLQPLKSWKQPICEEKRCEPEGDFRTISFISDEKSPYGNDRLRKRFRYRSVSGLGLDGVVAHWKDFVWTAGPVCVQHNGHPWGNPQVWAVSAAEGKRVIQHAGREAGVDPNQVGQWAVSGSNNPRYGMQGTMRVNTKGGYYWISSRLGPDERPLVQEL